MDGDARGGQRAREDCHADETVEPAGRLVVHLMVLSHALIGLLDVTDGLAFARTNGYNLDKTVLALVRYVCSTIPRHRRASKLR